jgi:hypothetical protein
MMGIHAVFINRAQEEILSRFMRSMLVYSIRPPSFIIRLAGSFFDNLGVLDYPVFSRLRFHGLAQLAAQPPQPERKAYRSNSEQGKECGKKENAYHRHDDQDGNEE